jgi:hypothetical protein
MKKLLLLSAAGLLCTAAGAQKSSSKLSETNLINAKGASVEKVIFAGNKIQASRYNVPSVPNGGTGAKTAATPFVTETFGSGTATGLPTGWTQSATGTGIVNGWRFTKTAATGSFNIGALNSTTAADGWMIYDSDSVGDKSPTVSPFGGSLMSPNYSTSGHLSVQVSFQQWYRRFSDSCFVATSTDNGVTWTEYPVVENIALNNNTNIASNPFTSYVNVSASAANKPQVMFRLRYSCNFAGGSFNWLVDDFQLSELDPVQVAIGGSAVIQPLAGTSNPSTNPSAEYTSYTTFSRVPLQLSDTLFPISFLSNKGSVAQAAVPLNVKIVSGATSVLDKTTTHSSNLPVGAVDSVTDFQNAFYVPNAVGVYNVTYSANAVGDAVTSDNLDSSRFAITSDTFTTYGRNSAGGYYLHRARGASNAELSYYTGSRFDIPVGKSDTLTGVQLSFGSGTAVGSNTIVEIYRIRASGSGASLTLTWEPVISTTQKTLAAGDINPSGSTALFTTYKFAARASNLGNYVLGAGTYAVVAKTIGATGDVVLNAASPVKATATYTGYFGQFDTSNNATGNVFGANSGIRTGNLTTPLVRLLFQNNARDTLLGPPPPPTQGVQQIAGVTIGDAFPNPANTSLNIPVATTTGKDINVSLSNMFGQTIMTQPLGLVGAGQSKNVVFNTSNLAAGTYIYSVESEGKRVSKQVVIAH